MWTWHWIIPTGRQYNFGDNPVFDWVRVLCVIAAVVMAFAIAKVVLEQRRREIPMTWHQTLRFGSLLLAALSLSLTELAVVGTPATPRLVVNLLCLTSGYLGVFGARHFQIDKDPVV